MNIKIISVIQDKDFYEVSGLVPARCALGYYHVKIKIQGHKLIESSCDCGQKLCPHAIKLELAFMRYKDKLSS